MTIGLDDASVFLDDSRYTLDGALTPLGVILSTWSSVCDAVSADLRTNVSALASATLHLYAPWSPEELVSSVGETHLAVWPTGEAESANPLSTGAHELDQSYVILYWEDASTQDGRRKEDPTADAALLTLHDAMRARLYVTANQSLGGGNVSRVWYSGTTFAEQSAPVRWFAMKIDVRAFQAFT